MKSTDENVSFCGKQVSRLQGTRFFDNLSTAALSELRSAIVGASVNQAQAEAIVTVWLSEHSEYPTPADIYAIGRTMNAPAVASATMLPGPCERCAEIPGYIRVTYTVNRGVFAGETRDGLVLCGCARGKAMGEAALRVKASDPSNRPEVREGFTALANLITADPEGRVS